MPVPVVIGNPLRKNVLVPVFVLFVFELVNRASVSNPVRGVKRLVKDTGPKGVGAVPRVCETNPVNGVFRVEKFSLPKSVLRFDELVLKVPSNGEKKFVKVLVPLRVKSLPPWITPPKAGTVYEICAWARLAVPRPNVTATAAATR